MVNREVEGDLIEEGISLVKKISEGSLNVLPIVETPINDGCEFPNVELGHLSKAIDSILIKTIYEGATMTLEDGLEFEARQFGECMKTEDMKIGLKNFLNNGPKVKAQFVHK